MRYFIVLPCLIGTFFTNGLCEEDISVDESIRNIEINSSLNHAFLTDRPTRFDYHKLVEITSPCEEATLNEETPLCPGLPQVLFHLTSQDGFDLWDKSETTMTALVSPSIYEMLKEMTKLNITVLNENIQDVIDRETFDIIHAKNTKSNSDILANWFLSYHNYEETKSFYEKLVGQYSSLTEWIPSIGRTFEGRDIFALKIGRNINSPNSKIVYVQSLQHAREWIAGSTINYLAYSLVSRTTERFQKLLEKITFVLVPIVNPDGYEYTWTTNRLWRKNRKYYAPFYGTDLNRNWDSYWSTSGYSTNPNSDTFQGPAPASEEETKSIQKLYSSLKGVIGALDVHSFSQLLLWPWSWTSKPYKYRQEHVVIGRKMAAAIYDVAGRHYIAEDSSALYPCGGAAQDFFCDDKVIPLIGSRPYAFTLELRPSSNMAATGFVVSPTQIVATGQEILAGILVFAEHALENPLPL